MIVHRSTNLVRLLRSHLPELVAVIGIVVAVEVANDYVDLRRPAFSFAALAVLATAVTIFLVFRFNEAYARWWEARTLWGGIVNSSRSFARQATSLVSEAGDAAARELVYRQLAWVNALRLHLRDEEDGQALETFLGAEERRALQGAANVPAQLLQRQGERLAELRAAGRIDGYGHWMLDATLSALCDYQGACERIKRTVFPDRVAYFTRVASWTIAVLIPFSLKEAGAGGKIDWLDMVVVPPLMLAFLITERLGAELKNPFEGLPNDTPMTALCRSIEIDLRQQLGESDVPPPAEPVGGVLM